MGDPLCVVEANFGVAEYRVRFDKILCGKRHFASLGDFTDIDEIERYGNAISAAKKIRDAEWFLTDEKNLVCGSADNGLSVLLVNIDIAENLDCLSSPLFAQSIKPDHGFKVTIAGLDTETSRDGMWCIFSPVGVIR